MLLARRVTGTPHELTVLRLTCTHIHTYAYTFTYTYGTYRVSLLGSSRERSDSRRLALPLSVDARLAVGDVVEHSVYIHIFTRARIRIYLKSPR